MRVAMPVVVVMVLAVVQMEKVTHGGRARRARHRTAHRLQLEVLAMLNGIGSDVCGLLRMEK